MGKGVAQKTFLVVTALLMMLGPSIAGESKKITSENELDELLNTYYLNPRPELISDAILFMNKEKLFEKQSAEAPSLAFFALVFQNNQDRTPKWNEVINSTNGKTRELLSTAMTMAKEKDPIMKIREHSPSVNDMYWAAFFATGDERYLGRLVDELRYVDERSSMELFVTGASAKWSLAANAARHKKVRAYLQITISSSQSRTGDIVKDLLEKGPEKVRSETIEILKAQKDKGRW